MKKYCYIAAFAFLGFLVSMLLHAVLEIPMLALVTKYPDIYGQSFIWRHWDLVHGVGGKFLTLSCVLLGFFLGQKFWRILYVEKRYGTPRW